jgi:hypothetical protein
VHRRAAAVLVVLLAAVSPVGVGYTLAAEPGWAGDDRPLCLCGGAGWLTWLTHHDIGVLAVSQ